MRKKIKVAEHMAVRHGKTVKVKGFTYVRDVQNKQEHGVPTARSDDALATVEACMKLLSKLNRRNRRRAIAIRTPAPQGRGLLFQPPKFQSTG